MRVAILGASGYTGGELLRLLLSHPLSEVVFISSESLAGKPAALAIPTLRHYPKAKGVVFKTLNELPKVDIAFSCLPSGRLPEILQFVADRSNIIFNLAGDYRLKARQDIERHYPNSLRGPWPDSESYFIPEFCADIQSAKVISLPGCMAAAALYALYPLCRLDLIEDNIIVDAKTGSSGAGKTDPEHPAERVCNFRAYKLHGHRHQPEITQALKFFARRDVDLQFSTHSLDLPRGIFVTAYTKLREGVTTLDVKRAYIQSYLKTPFVHYLSPRPGRLSVPMIKTVVGTNFVDIASSIEGRSCVTVAALDNLLKGAAGQAIQALNRFMGVDETLGLAVGGMWP